MILKNKNPKLIYILAVLVSVHLCVLSSLPTFDTGLNADDYDDDDDDVESKEFANQMHKEVAYIYFDQLMHKLVNWLKVKLASGANGLTHDEEQIFNTVYVFLLHMRKEAEKEMKKTTTTTF